MHGYWQKSYFEAWIENDTPHLESLVKSLLLMDAIFGTKAF
jgi:hypothetical protein